MDSFGPSIDPIKNSHQAVTASSCVHVHYLANEHFNSFWPVSTCCKRRLRKRVRYNIIKYESIRNYTGSITKQEGRELANSRLTSGPSVN